MKRLGIFIALTTLLIAAPISAEPPGATTVPSHRTVGALDAVTLQPIRLGGALQSGTAQLLEIYSRSELERGVYVGSQFCLACHPNRGAWEETLHARFLRRPLVQNSLIPRRGVIADYDGNGVDDFIQGLDFNAINSAFDPYKPNAPKLSVEGGQYFITIGQLKCPVAFTQAGQAVGNTQRYVVRIPVSDSPTGFSDSNYFAPLQFTATGWATNSPQNWYDASNNPRWTLGVTTSELANHGGNYARTCVGCHSTGIRRVGQNPSGEYSFDGFVAVLFDENDETVFDWDLDGNYDLMNIGCESCHGPGSAHILGGGDPSQIVNPEDLPVSAQIDICGRCHTQPASVPNGTWAWPYNDATNTDYTPRLAAEGVPLTDFMTDASVRWPDGVHGKISRPYHDYVESPKPTFRFNMVSCTDCHSPHREAQPHMIRTSITEDGIRVATEVENNTLCLACHAGFGPFADLNTEMIADIEEEANHDEVAKVVSAHSHHPYAPERRFGLSRCVECHMPAMGGRGTLTVPSHVFDAVAPELTLEFQAEGGMPNGCAQSCHGFKVDVFGLGIDPNPNNSVWDEPFDRALARELLLYYGPGGMWWNTDDQ
jgi:hypothetical protein